MTSAAKTMTADVDRVGPDPLSPAAYLHRYEPAPAVVRDFAAEQAAERAAARQALELADDARGEFVRHPMTGKLVWVPAPEPKPDPADAWREHVESLRAGLPDPEPVESHAIVVRGDEMREVPPEWRQRGPAWSWSYVSISARRFAAAKDARVVGMQPHPAAPVQRPTLLLTRAGGWSADDRRAWDSYMGRDLGRPVAELEAKIAGLEAALATAEREADPSEPIDPKHGLRGEYDRMVWRDSRERHAASLRQMLIPLRRELADQLEVLAVVDEIDRACAELAKSAEAAQ